jgi:hypothetical protein
MSSPNLKASTFAAHFRAFGANATNADSFQPFLDLMLITVLDNQRALAGALSDEPNVCALLALSANSVGLGHHFFYDGATPLHPKRSNALFMLQGRQRFPHQPHFCLMTSWRDLPRRPRSKFRTWQPSAKSRPQPTSTS